MNDQPESQPAVPAQVEKPWWDHWRPESDYPEAAAAEPKEEK